MRYIPCWQQIGITKERYQELLFFCRQYPYWKKEANRNIGIKAIFNDGMPHGNKKRDPVAVAAENREKVLSNMALVEECARSVSGGEWYTAIMQNVCYGKAFEMIDVESIPASNRKAYFKQRRLFFELLNQKKD